MQRVPVRIAIDAKQLAEHPLRIGLSMKADVNLHDQKGTVLPVDAAKGTVYGTEVYAKQLQDADALIHTIIQGNLPSSARAS
ncbi:putative multidrug resistance protein EmrK [compost metagenome]